MEANRILKLHHLKATPCRIGILEELIGSDTALSESQLKQNIEQHFDRSTFYRSLKALVDANVIHSIRLDEAIHYMLNSDFIPPNKSHSHFYCADCGKVICIPPNEKENITIPSGFKVKKTEIILKGTCKHCNN